MGFRTGAYAYVWEVTPETNTRTKLRISIGKKDKDTGTFSPSFSGYVSCAGTAAADKASKLHEGSRIKIGDCDVTTKYDKVKEVKYTNFTIFSFEDAEGESVSAGAAKLSEPEPSVDDGLVDDSKLPF